jgi:putative DNA primase/helicase
VARMTLTDLLARVLDVREEGDAYVGLCPAHADRTPSLRIARTADGTVLLKCRAGCSYPAVLAALDLDGADLFEVPAGDATLTSAPASVPAGPRDVAALRMYVEAAAARLQSDEPDAIRARSYLAERFGVDAALARELKLGVDPGGIRDLPTPPFLPLPFRRGPRVLVPLADGAGVIRGLQGRALDDDPVRWSSLRNPESGAWSAYGVVSQGAGHSAVVIAEGPGDALTAVATGYDVVTIPGASRAHSPAVRHAVAAVVGERTAILCGDRDAAGTTFVTQLADGLAGAGVAVRVLAVPDAVPGKDLTDWRADVGPAAFPAAFHAALAAASAPSQNLPPAGPAVPATSGPPPRDPEHTDLGNACRVRDGYDGLIRWSPALGFLVWNGYVWRVGADVAVRTAIQDNAFALIAEGRRLQGIGHPTAAAVLKWGKTSAASHSLDGVFKTLQALDGVPLDADSLDCHPELLPCLNGTVNLETGILKPPDPTDLLTQSVEFEYNPKAKATRWELFLTECFPDNPAIIEYLQRLVGYGITGYTREQCFVLLYGSGANGKSIFTSALHHVFRRLTADTDVKTFIQNRHGVASSAPTPDLAQLRGARLCLTSESEHGDRLAEALLKRVTGGDPIVARHLQREPMTFLPAFLLMLSTNGLPDVRGHDEGIWRRIRVVHWEQTFGPDRRDNRLGEKLQTEAEGILAWAVAGAQRWAATDLGSPLEVAQAVSEYRAESDALAGFYPGRVVAEPGAWMSRAELWGAYEEWHAGQGLDADSRWRPRTFYSILREAGLITAGRNGVRGFAGVRLATPADRRRDGDIQLQLATTT